MAKVVSRTARDGFAAGAIGAVVMIVAQGIARAIFGVPMFPDLLEDLATRLIPAPIFSRVLDTLHFQAKPLLFVGLLVVQVVAGAVIGGGGAIWFSRRSPGSDARETVLVGIGLAAALWVITGLLILPIAGQGLFGTLATTGTIGLNLTLLLGFLVYGITITGLLNSPDAFRASPRSTSEVKLGADAAMSSERRRLLGGVAVGAVALVAAGAAYKILAPGQAPISLAPIGSAPVGPLVQPPPPVSIPQPPAISTPATISSSSAAPTSIAAGQNVVAAANSATATTVASSTGTSEWSIKGLASDVTPTKDFYEVSKDFFSNPHVDQKSWVLQVAGAVAKPYGLGYDDLLKLPAVERYQSLQCISNEIGGNLISNAQWRGVSLADVLRAAQPQAGALKVVFTASDGYQDSIPFDRAINGDNLIAHTMNGEALVAGHGAPARLLIPGIYGMKNVKWLTKIEVVTTNFLGYWQTRGWSDDAFINTMSRFDVPSSDQGAPKAGRVQLAGLAFGGDKGISKVEVSTDKGNTWQTATLKDPLGQYTWRLWRYDWTATPGEHTMLVRATNGKGELQTSTVTDTLPNGATGWHAVTVSVVT